MKNSDRPLSPILSLLTAKLTKLDFAGLDQNPFGIRDLLGGTVAVAETLENEVSRLREAARGAAVISNQTGAALREMEAAAANWRLVEQLRAEEGNEVRIPCDNGDFVGPGAAVTVAASWTDWNERRFEGDNVHACLTAAVEAMKAAEKANG